MLDKSAGNGDVSQQAKVPAAYRDRPEKTLIVINRFN